jgi:hypothetical protein
MGIVRVSGRGQFVCHGSVVMAGWRCPRSECIFTMADRYQDRPFPTDADHDRGANPYVRGESDPLAELIGQTDPFGTPAKPPFRCSRGPMSARNTPPRRQK